MIEVPTIPPEFPRLEREYPISPRENIMRMMRHEKPAWMPTFSSSVYIAPTLSNGDMPADMFADSIDWFGTKYRMSEAQGSNTPQPGMFGEITEWRDKVAFPDLGAWDFMKGYEDFSPDAAVATIAWLGNGLFERLHIFEGFENALVDLISAPEECMAFFERMVDHRLEVFKRLNDIYHYDFIIYNDDWGTMKGPFFSMSLFEQTLLGPTKRLVKGMQAEGTLVHFHNCGKIEDFVPYLVEEIGTDGLQIQPSLNDVKALLARYGDKVTIDFTPDKYRMFDPAATPDGAREYAREIVDAYGAHVNPGAGVFVIAFARTEEIYRAFEDELYEYSIEKYKNCQENDRGEEHGVKL